MVTLWDTATWEPRFRLTVHRDPVKGVTFAPDGRTLASRLRWDRTDLGRGNGPRTGRRHRRRSPAQPSGMVVRRPDDRRGGRRPHDSPLECRQAIHEHRPSESRRNDHHGIEFLSGRTFTGLGRRRMRRDTSGTSTVDGSALASPHISAAAYQFPRILSRRSTPRISMSRSDRPPLGRNPGNLARCPSRTSRTGHERGVLTRRATPGIGWS